MTPTLPILQTKLQITILAVGSRGDLQPYCALAVGLQRAGHKVKIATHKNFAEFVSQMDFEFAPLAVNFQELLRSPEGQKLLAGQKSKLISDELFQDLLSDARLACQGSDVIIYTSLSTWGYNIAEELGVPCFFAGCIPLTPTRTFPFLKFAEVSTNPVESLLNYASYFLMEFVLWRRSRKVINNFRTQTLKLPPLPFLGRRFRRKVPILLSQIPILYGFSPSVIPKPVDWPDSVHITGYWFLDQAKDYQPPQELVDFIHDGTPPVCIGFGSMIASQPELLTEIVLEALKISQQRGILLSGWAGIASEVKNSDQVFVIDSVPHDWLFPKMGAVVHHGGASTTAAGLRAGVPSVIVPFFADQPSWGKKLYQLGVSPSPIPYKDLSSQALATAIQEAVNNETIRSNAIALSNKIKQEDGIANAVKVFHHYLGMNT
ncbi:glycosyltransferase [Scytonema sp. NUACC26]|uniref:glycosyltransferase n=1 Tax=Scytonema sp. NUACC26 TaxID=3140176 RepID=UPI0034DCA785